MPEKRFCTVKSICYNVHGLKFRAQTEAFQESVLPIRVDVLDWNALSPEFRQVILNHYLVVQRKSDETSG